MSSNVIDLGRVTRLDGPATKVLDDAKGVCPDGVIIIGYDKSGETYYATSIADGGTVLWLIEHAKLALMGIE